MHNILYQREQIFNTGVFKNFQINTMHFQQIFIPKLFDTLVPRFPAGILKTTYIQWSYYSSNSMLPVRKQPGAKHLINHKFDKTIVNKRQL
jgi:hypothetical protein